MRRPFLLAVLLATTIALAGNEETPGSEDRAFIRGTDLLRRGETARAAEVLETLLLESPESWQTRGLSGLFDRARGLHVDALAAIGSFCSDAPPWAVLRVFGWPDANPPQRTDGCTGPKALPEDKPGPSYPEQARRERIEGQVRVLVFIDETGAARPVCTHTVQTGLGFEAATANAIDGWRYTPATCDGVATPTFLDVFVQFSLQ